MTDNVLQPQYHAPSDQATNPDSLKSSNEHPTFSSEATSKVMSQDEPSQIRDYHPPSSRQTAWTTLQSSKDEPSGKATTASAPGVSIPGSFPRTISEQSENQTSAAGTWDATVNGLKELLPTAETVTNTLSAAQATAQKTAQEYGPKAAEGAKAVVDAVAGYLPGSSAPFAQQGASTPMPANEYGGAPFNRGLESTNQVDAADLDQPQISDDAIAEAAQRLAKKGPLAGPEKPFSEATRSQSDVLADKGEPVPRPTTHIPGAEETSAPGAAHPRETTSHISRVTSLPSRPHHMPPAFGTEHSDVSLPAEVPPTPPSKDVSQVFAKDTGAAGVRKPEDQSAADLDHDATAEDDAASLPQQSGVHLIPTQEHVLTGKTIPQSIDEATPAAATDAESLETDHRPGSTPTERTSSHGQVASQGTTASTDSSQSDGGKPKLKDRLRGEVKVLTGKIKHDDKLVQEGRRLLSGSPGSH